MNNMDLTERVKKIIEIFNLLYEDAKCSLDFRDPLQLLISTQLSAQCTDERVNIVSKSLYKKYKTIDDFAGADLEELEQDIKSTGFYKNKARNIKKCCIMLIENFDRIIPNNLEDLLKLPGVGRKTANLFLGDIHGIPGIVVDTHARRLANRIGLTKTDDVVKIEFDLMKIVPKENWNVFCHQLVYHGRSTCKARKPNCEECKINYLCERSGV